MKQPLVSVVMPSYNHADYVGRAIESVLQQTYINFEFIIADDGSVDESAEIISQYTDSRIRFMRVEKNTGFGAYEYALEQAQGEYIATIASDDMWEETLLETYIGFLEENKEYGCCFCPPKVIDENDNIIENSEFYQVFTTENKTKEEWFKQLYLKGNAICAPSMCIRKSIYDKVGIFRFQYKQLQDYEYWLRLVQVCNFYIYPERLIKYRVHKEGNNKNISAHTQDSLVRGRIETKYILFDIMENLEPDFFLNAFADDLILKPHTDGFCVECEKFGVMLKNSLSDPAIYYYFKHYNNYEFRNSLENYYGIVRKEFWELTGTDHDKWYENVKNKNKVVILTRMVQELLQELRTKEQQQCENKLVIMQLLQYEVQLKEGMDEKEVISAWLHFVGENYKQLVYEEGFEQVLFYTLNEYKKAENKSLDIEVKKEITKLWSNFNRNIFQCYQFNVMDMTHKLQLSSEKCKQKSDRNTVSVIVIENEQEWKQDMQEADVVLTLEDIEHKDYSIVQQLFGKDKQKC